MTAGSRAATRGSETRAYLVAGIPCAVTAGATVLEIVEATFGAFRCEAAGPQPYTLRVDEVDGRFAVVDPAGRARACDGEAEAVFATLEGLVRHVTDSLAGQGVYAIHAASLARHGKGIVICGPSGAGKTTLAMALLARGFGLLSDEFALSASDGHTILPYHRGVHVRAGTVELVDALALIRERPHQPVSGGFRWTLAARELEELFPSCLSGPVPLGYVVLLEPSAAGGRSSLEEVSKGTAAVELLRATTAASTDFDGVLARMAALVAGVPCLRLRAGRLESSLELLEGLQ